MSTSVIGLDASAYAAHPLHSPERAWQETNCYVDLWIEVLHGLRLDPHAALAFTVGLDFEGDQYTFYKYPLADLQDLYGIEVQELNVWRPLVQHAVQQVTLGRLFMPEVDSWYLPDTKGVSYRREHVKSSIAIQHIDPRTETLGYFHGAGYHVLTGEDFRGVFRLDEAGRGPTVLPPYAEIAKVDSVRRLDVGGLVDRSLALLRRHLTNRPRNNPVRLHFAKLDHDIAWLRDEPIETFHQYAFATARQLGSCFGLTASYLRWLAQHGAPAPDVAVNACADIESTAKTLQYKLARVVSYRKPNDLASLFDRLAESWELVMAELDRRYAT